MRTKFSGILTLLLAFVVQLTFAQEKTISGVVSDDQGLPLPGVNIIIKGTSSGTQTGFDGDYNLQASQGDVLVFSYIGFESQEVPVGAASSYDVTMKAGNTLDDVVINVLGTKRKVDELVSANQVVSSEELTQANNPNAVVGLAGKVSGLQINTTNSGVEQNTRIVLRGNRSLTGNNEALIVIDGVISTSQVFTALDPNVIESINVIKGANGAALYGSQGANGVISITTKQGTGDGGKLKVDFASTTTFEDVAYLPQRQTRYGQGWNGEQVSYENGAWGPEIDGTNPMVPVGLPQEDGTYRYFPYKADADNLKDFFKTGTSFQNTVTVSGGTAKDGYAFLSAGKVDQEFVVEDDIADRTSINFKAGKEFGKWSLSGNATYITSKTETTNGGLYEDLLQTATTIPVGEFTSSNLQDHWTSYYRNPNWIRENERNTSRYDIFTGIANIGFQFNDNISARYTANIRTRQTNSRSYVNGYIDTENIGGGDFTTQSQFSTNNTALRNFYSDLIISFDYMLNDDLNLKVDLGNNLRDNLFTTTAVGGTPTTLPGFYNADNIEGTPTVSNGYTRSRTYSYFGKATLGYKDFVFFDVTGRNDKTSVLSQDNNSFFYPSAGLSLILTKAIPSLKGDILNYAKISGGFARVGNAVVSAYDINDIYVQPAGYPYGGLNSFLPSVTVADPNLENEFLNSTEINLNLGFFNDRITLDGSAFMSKNENQIVTASSSSASGILNSRQNLGETETKGFEVDLGFTPIKTENFRWNARLSYSTNETEVIKVSETASEVALAQYSSGGGGIGIFAIEGENFPTIKGSGYQRDPEGRVVINPATGVPVVDSELKNLGTSNPDYILGLNTSFEYKGLRLSATMDYRTGHQFFSGAKSWLSWSGHLIESAQNGRRGFIYPNSVIENPDGSFTPNTSVLTGGTTYANYLSYFQDQYYSVNENFVLDATAFKLRELALSYSLPSKLLESTSFQAVSLGLVARNILTVLPKENRGYNDPETSNTTGNDQGIAAVSQYPVTRSLGFTLNLSF
ncbi:TonB-linked SusC/RagA family outer membrane protein [Mesonia algae]|uniref:TonB-linked SusC/RagA family outer membrane protein n=1 Tax=Mesonia algae TaxID=213248 RepID=A0A2W7HV42_9FLAO|nr:SusC/RagA family TonB-linked outer membrane protein [Mesonia algae]PZW38611.1 TonB-linked SusC/RagA family outer membrane protein [Mesonia algae]